MARLQRQVSALSRCERGVAAVEFALILPFLCLGLLAMVDLGMATMARVELDRNVRAGAQAAITLDNPEPAIEAIVRAASGERSDLDVAVDIACTCGFESASCDRLCTTEEEPSVFYRIRASRPISGALLKDRTIASQSLVQVR